MHTNSLSSFLIKFLSPFTNQVKVPKMFIEENIEHPCIWYVHTHTVIKHTKAIKSDVYIFIYTQTLDIQITTHTCSLSTDCTTNRYGWGWEREREKDMTC